MAQEPPAYLAQGSLQNSSFDPPEVQQFLKLLSEKERTGVVFGANGPRKRLFIPDKDIKDFFNTETDRDWWKVNSLLKAATHNNPHNVHPDSVARDCPRVFSILIRIGYPGFIHEFVRKDKLQDHALPFGPDKEAHFPRLEGGRTFFKKFEEEQWQFCVEKLSYGLEEITFDDRRILPIKEIEELEKGDGVSGVVHKITIQEEYDDLKSSRDRQRPLSPPILKRDLHTYVIKTYHHSDGGRYFEAETRAFRVLNEADKLVPNVVGFHKAFKQNDSLNIILQYANVGTLEHYFENVPNPQLGYDILGVWRRLAALNTAVAGIHKQLPRVQEGNSQAAIFEGWHQDIKPANILVRGDVENDPYNVEFLLADLGLAHFTAFVKGQAGSTGEDLPGPRTYGAPEQNLDPTRISDYRTESKQKLDIWALACVYSEFNTWIVRGRSGVRAYRRAREKEAGTSHFGPIFHDKVQGHVLETVRQHHEELTRRKATEDCITPRIWSEMFHQLFTVLQVRPTALQLTWMMNSMLEQAERQLGAIQPPPPPLQALTTLASVNSEHTRAPSPPQTPEQRPPDLDDTFDHGDYPWTPQSGDVTKGSDLSRTRYSGNVAQSPDSLPLEERSSVGGTLNRDSDPSGSQPGGLGFPLPERTPPAMVTQSNRRATDLQRPASELAIRPTLTDTATDGRAERLPPATVAEQNSSPAYQPSLDSAAQTENDVMKVANSSTQAPSKGKERAKDATEPKPPAPELTVEQLATFANLTRASKRSFGPFNLGGSKDYPVSGPTYSSEESDLLHKMKERDHIFVIDDSVSMKEHWSKVRDLYGNLILMIKKKNLDPNGSQLQFIKSDYVNEKKDTSELIDAVYKHGYQLKGTTDFAAKLESILSTYLDGLEKDRSKSPISIYVLTNGVWEIRRATKVDKDYQLEHICNAIVTAVSRLEELRAKDKQIGIQFIRFGSDEIGRKRLKYLDEKIKKKKNLSRDICDTTPADGNVWKMMLGSIDSAWDDDAEDDADDSDDDRA